MFRFSEMILFALSLSLVAATSGATETTRADATFTGKIAGWVWEIDPDTQPYPDYLADPRRPRMQVGIGVYGSSIPKVSDGRVMLDAGTRYTLATVRPGGDSKSEFALDVEGALFTQFDAGNQLDAVGWDGRFGIWVVQDWNRRVVWRMGYRHLSAHLGDEYIETTGRKRVGYTRDMLALGVSLRADEHLTVYVEPTWAWGLGNERRQKRWSLEGGVSYEGPRVLWNGSTAWYGGVHVRSFQETGWEPGVSVQTGYHIKRSESSSNLRLALEGYVGRSILGEFALDYYDAYATLGLIFDFY